MNTDQEIAELKKRMDYQESIHQNITLNPDAYLHGVISNGFVILSSVIIATLAVHYISKIRS